MVEVYFQWLWDQSLKNHALNEQRTGEKLNGMPLKKNAKCAEKNRILERAQY